MNRSLFRILAAATCLVGCSAQIKPEAVTAPEKVIVAAGGTGYLSVKVDREQVPGKAKVALEQLPEGVTVVGGESEKTLEKESDAEASFTLLASASVPVGTQYEVNVTVAGEKAAITKKVKLDVVDYSLRSAGWLVMSISVATVVALLGFCLYRVLTLPPVEQEHVRGPLDIDTGDTRDAD
jgi:hypothetical protein